MKKTLCALMALFLLISCGNKGDLKRPQEIRSEREKENSGQ